MKIKNKIIILLILIFSCKQERVKDYKKIVITDFFNNKIDTLVPYKNKSYYSYYVKIKGHSNDSFKIQRKGYYDIILSGEIDTIINGDYYGIERIIWTFNPYNATKGRLEIDYSL